MYHFTHKSGRLIGGQPRNEPQLVKRHGLHISRLQYLRIVRRPYSILQTIRTLLIYSTLACGAYVGKGKVFPYSLLSVGPGADPSKQAVSPQVTFKATPRR